MNKNLYKYQSVINPTADLKDSEQKKQLFEQYKLFLDASAKTANARKETNGLYITINSVILSTVGAVGGGYIFPDKSLIFLITLMIIGIGCIISWISVLTTYKDMDQETFEIIKELETFFPSCIHTRFNQVVARETTQDNDKGFLAKKERIIPYAFLIGYTLFILSDLYKIYIKTK